MSRFIVLALHDRQRYDSEHDAIIAAHKLAKEMPGTTFSVLEVKGEACVATPAVEYRRADYPRDDERKI